jgi:hypothetical protein
MRDRGSRKISLPRTFLYMRVLGAQVTTLGDELLPDSVVFRNHGEDPEVRGMSTDWSRYATPQETRKRARKRPPSMYGVISLSVGKVRTIPFQRDKHTPIFNAPEDPDNPNNRAHTDVLGPKSKDETGDRRLSTEIRNRFQEISVWEIYPDDPVAEAENRSHPAHIDSAR